MKWIALVLSLLTLALSGCSICGRTGVAGRYAMKNSFDIIELNEDSSFLYIITRRPVGYLPSAISNDNGSSGLHGLNKPDFFVVDSIIGNYMIVGQRYLVAKLPLSYYITEKSDAPQYTTIRVYDEKTKDPMELAIIELYEGPFIVGELFTDNSGCVTINDNNCDSVRIKFIEHNAITVCDPIKYNTINVYMTQKYDWWIKEWKIVSKRKIKQLGTTGNVFIKQNN